LQIYHSFEHLDSIRNPVVTTGSFDGVHTGHKAILERLKKLALEIRGETVLITFQPHPRKVLYPDTFGKELRLITSLREKIELLSRAGLDHLIIVPFTKEFSEISSVDFVRNILLKKLHARKIITGFNHHFGHNREGDTELMQQLGQQFHFDFEEIPEQEVQQESVSSVTIRKSILEGDIRQANRYLDHPYLITGQCLSIQDQSTTTGKYSYSIHLEEDSKLLPPDGSYPVTVIDDDDKYPASCMIKNHPGLPLKSAVIFETDDELSCSSDFLTILFQDFTQETMHIDILTIFPEMLEGPFRQSIIKRAQEKELISIALHNFRDYSLTKHKHVDDYPYGGGAGMVMMAEPIVRCIESLTAKRAYDDIIYLTPDGEILTQKIANQISVANNLILLCGHYKGIDERVRELVITREISIGNYVLSGGELAAAVLVDSVVRLIPGVLGDETSALSDSFQDDLLSPPVYTRPYDFRGKTVPDILLSGNDKEIAKWRHEESLERTRKRRPGLFDPD